MGERVRCSDSNCGCEIEVTTSGRLGHESYSASPVNTGSQSRSPSERPIGGSVKDESGVGSLRNAESASVSTPGDFGSPGTTGEGVLGTSGGNQRSPASGRLASTGSSLKSGSQGSSSTSNIETGSSGESVFYCACGQPMQKNAALRPRSKDVISSTAESNSAKTKKATRQSSPLAFSTLRMVGLISGSQIPPPSVAGASFPSHTKILRC